MPWKSNWSDGMTASKKFNWYSAVLAIATLGFLTMVPAWCAAGQADAQGLFTDATKQLDQDQFVEAAAEYDKCLAADPHMLKALFDRAIANEMVDRQKAIADWKTFAQEAQNDPDLKWLAARAAARAQILESMPALPEGLSPSRYVAADSDYYRLVAEDSDGLQWGHFPVKIYLGSAPQVKWQYGAREAFDIWRQVFPLQLVANESQADIRIGWNESVTREGRAGEELDWVEFKREGDAMTGRRVAVITVDLSRPWSKDEMRAIMLHEFGHALGIKGHSDSKKDIMYFQMQEKYRRIPVPMPVSQFFWKSLVKNPSQRDLNTLVRLYNSAGYVAPLH
jgi:predicted Zn-dependent protease